MRLFIAIELPDEVKRGLVAPRRGIPGVRWVPQEQIHLTLLFLGEVGEEQVAPLCRALAEVSGAPFTLTLSGTGCFPNNRRPRVFWVGLDPQPALDRLAEGVKRAAESCGITTEERPFTPHITLARIRPPAPFDTGGRLAQWVPEGLPPISVREFVLFQSILEAHGALHRPVRAFPLPETNVPPACYLDI